jgi:hypothetical protein
MPAPEPPGTVRVLPMQRQVGDQITDESGAWQVIARPYSSAGGKHTQVRVQRVDQPGVAETRLWGSYEKVTVRRALTRVTRHVGVLLALALLTYAASAYAQSKYLLWSHFILRDGEQWQVNYAFESKKECKSAAAAVLREAARRGNTVAGDHITTASGDLSPVCLPDTVDPRGPETK